MTYPDFMTNLNLPNAAGFGFLQCLPIKNKTISIYYYSKFVFYVYFINRLTMNEDSVINRSTYNSIGAPYSILLLHTNFSFLVKTYN